MARKKQEVALQTMIETQEEFEEILSKEGLTIMDVFQEWAGPCKAMISNFRKLKMELGDELLRFATAKADTVDALEKYRGKCKPCFLFYAKDVLVHAERGANVPTLLKAINDQLKAEHQVLDGQAERKPIMDPEFTAGSATTLDDETEEEEEGGGDSRKSSAKSVGAVQSMAQRKGVTVAILKPNVVAAGKVDEIIAKIEERGIEILEKTEMTMTKEDAEEFYAEKKEEEYFEKMIEFMTSGPSVVLALSKGETGEGIIEEWRDLLGPANVEEAKESQPDSLRAQYGEESYINAVHGSSSDELAMQELAFFFPTYNAPVIPGSDVRPQTAKVQRTLALIRPDALRERKDEIMAKIEEAGFKVAMQKEMMLSREQVGEFYKEHKEQPYFEELVNRMTNGPLLALALAREEAVESWRTLLGPKEVDKAKEEAPDSLRAQFALEEVPINQIHGSADKEEAQKELDFFFPMQQTVAVVKPDAYQTKEEIMSKIKEAGFHIAAKKETELTEEIAREFYRDHEGKDYYDDLTNHMTSGPTLFMVLSREDAVDGWRGLIGPTDPTVAKEEAPESIRAQFGSDLKANAVHGSSDPEHAKKHIQLVFGEELEFNPDGTLIGGEQGGEEPAATEQAATEQAAETAADGEQKQEGEKTEQSQPEQAAEQQDTEKDVQQSENTEGGGETQAQTEKSPEEKAPTPAQEGGEGENAAEETKEQTEQGGEGENAAGETKEQTEQGGETAAEETKEQTEQGEEQSPGQAAETTEAQAPEQEAEGEAPAAEEQATTEEQPPTAEGTPKPAEEQQATDEQPPAAIEEAPAAQEQTATDEQAPAAEEAKPEEGAEQKEETPPEGGASEEQKAE